MGIGRILISNLGMKHKYQGLFEKFLKIGIMGLGYEQPMKSLELEEITLAKALTSNDKPIIFDVGANKGQYIDLIKKVLKNKFVIYSFEPDKFNYQHLCEKYKSDDIRIFPFGLGERKELLTFHRHKQDDLSTFHYSVENHPSNYRSKVIEEKLEVELQTIDDFLKTNSIDSVDFLKIDTEGHDYFVLKGGFKALESGKIKNIQFEFSEMNIASRTTFFDFWNLLNNKYNVYRMCKDRHYEIKEYIPMLHEIYHPVNFFASLKKRNEYS